MSLGRVQRFLLAGSLVLVLVVLLFSAFLNISAFRNNYASSLLSSYSVVGGEARRQIEYATRYGKSLDNFANIETILRQIPAIVPRVQAVNVVMPDGRILYDLDGAVPERQLPDALRLKADFRNEAVSAALKWMRHEGRYHAFLPIRERSGAWVGTLDLIIDASDVDQRTADYVRTSAWAMLMIALAAVVVMLVLLVRVRVVDLAGEILQRRFAMLLVVVLSLAQLAYAAVNISLFHQVYPAIVADNARLGGEVIARTVDGVLKKGIALDDMSGVDDWLRRVLASTPQIERIELRSASGAVLHSTDKETNAAPRAGIEVGPPATAYGQTPHVVLVPSATHLANKIGELALDAATMLVISFFFMGEIIVFLVVLLKKRIALERVRHTGEIAARRSADSGGQLVRPLAFLLLLAGSLSLSFVPVMMSELYQPLFGLSRLVVIGLPISVEMFGAFLSSLLIGHLIDVRGWRPAFLGGLLFFGAGTVLSGQSTSAIEFVAARGLVGLGYGAAWMGLRGLVSATPEEGTRTYGFTMLNAGIYAGLNCGAVLGAMLAERIGFAQVFLIATVLTGVTAAFALLMMHNVLLDRTEQPGHIAQRTRNFFTDQDVLALLLFVTIPAAAASMFLNYYFPLFAHSLGVAQSDIGRGFLGYGVCMIYIGPYVLLRLRKQMGSRAIMAVAGAVGVSGLLVFAAQPCFATAVVAVLLLGIAESLGLVSQNSYFVGLPAALALGRGKALSVFSAIKKIGQMIGPGALGLATTLGVTPGVAIMAGTYLASTVAFVVANRQTGRDRAAKHNNP
jgi:predicted MFS family arabinose efflux permease